MTLAETVRRKIAEWRPPAEGRLALAVPDEGAGWSASVTADRSDEVGCLVWEVALRSSAGPVAADGAGLGAWANQAAQRVTGLLEALKVVEVDPARNEALLRSDIPAWQGDDVSYYEVVLHGLGRVTAQRFRGSRQPGQRREQVLFSLTHDALAKLVGDLVLE
jgi:hypothetical protein